jgi:broad specificity phosphatase PhoE
MTTPPPDIVETRWFWVRHAPVPDGGRIYGQRDLDCDCSDDRVFRAVARALPNDAIWVTSGLKRAMQTAAAIHAASDGLHAPAEIPAHDAFNEQHLGDWQGLERGAFRRAHGITAMDFWLTKGDERAPGGESFPDLVARVVPLIQDLGRRHAGRNIVTVTHGGTIRAALGHALGGPPDAAHAFTIDNCSITVLVHMRPADAAHPGVWRLAGVNLRPWEHARIGHKSQLA